MADTRAPRAYFSKVAVARQLLKEKAEEILQQYLRVVDEARVSGDYETAAKSLQWLIEHMPNDTDGEAMVQVSIDKKQQEVQKQDNTPRIQIGIAVGGLGPDRSLANVKKPREIPAIIEVLDPEEDGRQT